MADPVTLAVIGMTATAIGGGVSAYGAYSSGKAQQQMYNYQSGVALANQQIAKQNADYALQAGESKAQVAGLTERFQEGKTKAQQGAGNLDVGSGSAMDVRASEHEIGQEDQAVIRAGAAKTAYGYGVEAYQEETKSQLDIMAGKNSAKAGAISATGTLLGTAGSVASKWSTFSQNFGSGDQSITMLS
jgi:alkanesulfonate monooxygenase SsuD/methylene tetrahydromethanopterin reductase-like flavin-dependent oxidoreductase (luciferase family)